MAELTPSLSGIDAEHPAIVTGIETIYGILIDMAYVQNLDVQVAPHGLPKEPIAVAPLRAAGLAPKTIELIGRLPWFTNEIIEKQRERAVSRDGIAVAPFSSASSYLLGSGRHDEAREVGVEKIEDSLPSTAFKLATTSSSEGYNLAYDLADKTILQWFPAGWAKCERISVDKFMADWIQKLRSLDWLPWVDEYGWEIEERQQDHERELAKPESAVTLKIKDELEQERQECQARGLGVKSIEEMFAQYLTVVEASQNRYWAKRHIYEECGWPDNFDQRAFARRRDEFNARAKGLGASASSRVTESVENSDRNAELRDFYKQGAGSQAV